MPPTSRTLFLSSYAVPIIFSPSITRCLFKETGRTIPSFLLFYSPHLVLFPPLIPPFSQLFPHSSSEEAIRHLPPLPPPPYSHLIPRYIRVSYVDTGESNPLRHSGHVSTAFFRDASPLRGVNFSYGHPPLSLQLSSSRMEFLRFRRTLCNTLYSRDEQGEREGGRQEGTAGFHNRCLSLSPALIHWTITLDCVCLSSEYMVEVYSLGLARWRVCLIRFDSI